MRPLVRLEKRRKMSSFALTLIFPIKAKAVVELGTLNDEP